jgi:hypothetical protein
MGFAHDLLHVDLLLFASRERSAVLAALG